MLLGMIVSLYTSRLILQALGVNDYGIYNVVGGFVSMFSLISTSLSASIWRFMTYELGTGNNDNLKKIFATSLLIQLAISLIIILACETFGLWFLNTELNISPDRMYAANWVFQASILSFVLGLLVCPYNAVIVAHERMNIYALFGIIDIILKLCVALFLAYAPFMFDRLIAYAFLTVGISILAQVFYMLYCRRHFAESRVAPHFHKSTWISMSGFAGWNAIGATAALLKDQGVNVLLNIFFGTVINAARGIAGTVLSAISGFTGNFMTALNPQITKSYAAGDKSYCFSLVERGSRFGFFILMFFAVPMIIEAPYVLNLWLGSYPAETIVFTRLVLVCAMVDILSNTLITLQLATGNIRNYQLAVGTAILFNFPLSWLFLKLGFGPAVVYWITIAISVVALLLRLTFLRIMTGLSMRNFIITVCFKVCLVCVVAAVPPAVVSYFMPMGIIRFLSTGTVSVLSSVVVILFLGCTSGERSFIYSKLRLVRQKLSLCFN